MYDLSKNHLILGDNLDVLSRIADETFDLIYLDPPFFSNRNYEVIWGDKGEIRSFEDRWSGGIDHYISWLKDRVEQMYRVLKPTGSLFLHCDWHASHYIKVDILDKIFGYRNFRNEIVWHYSGWNATLKNSFNKRYDSIFFYAKSEKQQFNGFTDNWQSEEEYIKLRKQKTYIDENGKKYVMSDGGKGKRVKRYIDDAMNYGKPVSDVWIFDKVNNSSKEKIGYPTQKPASLLERIILSCTNEGDFILDPFVGGGTTASVAERLGRRWIGIDQSVQAVKVSDMRLKAEATMYSTPFRLILPKYNLDELRSMDAFEFERFIIEQFHGVPSNKQRGDFGIDGKKIDGTPIQVKRSDDVGRNIVDNFRSAAERFNEQLFNKNKAEGNPIGYIIAFSFNKGAIQEVARLKNKNNTFIRLVTVDDIVPVAQKPSLQVSAKDLQQNDNNNDKKLVELTATAQSKNADIEFFAWDWSYNQETHHFQPDVFMDKEGKQVRHFEKGEHVIAVKVVDTEGLEETEIMRLEVNGGIYIAE